MGARLTREQLDNIKAYKYQTSEPTWIETAYFNKFWDFLADNCIPRWVSPNLLTLTGVIFPLVMLWTICVYSPGLDQTLPNWVPLLGCFAHFWY